MVLIRIMPRSRHGSPRPRIRCRWSGSSPPSGKVGYISADVLSPLGNDQVCYVKDATGWKITGYVGAGPGQ